MVEGLREILAAGARNDDDCGSLTMVVFVLRFCNLSNLPLLYGNTFCIPRHQQQ